MRFPAGYKLKELHSRFTMTGSVLYRWLRVGLSDVTQQPSKNAHLCDSVQNVTLYYRMGERGVLSCVSLTNPHLNQKAWNGLEKYCRSLTRHYQNVFVCTGPLYLPRTEADGKMYVKYQVIGKNNVAVPTHFFKVVILEKRSGEVELRSYVMPNAPVDENTPLERFLVPVESIERASGLLFVPNIMKRTSSLRAITAGGN